MIDCVPLSREQLQAIQRLPGRKVETSFPWARARYMADLWDITIEVLENELQAFERRQAEDRR